METSPCQEIYQTISFKFVWTTSKKFTVTCQHESWSIRRPTQIITEHWTRKEGAKKNRQDYLMVSQGRYVFSIDFWNEKKLDFWRYGTQGQVQSKLLVTFTAHLKGKLLEKFLQIKQKWTKPDCAKFTFAEILRCTEKKILSNLERNKKYIKLSWIWFFFITFLHYRMAVFIYGKDDQEESVKF